MKVICEEQAIKSVHAECLGAEVVERCRLAHYLSSCGWKLKHNNDNIDFTTNSQSKNILFGSRPHH